MTVKIALAQINFVVGDLAGNAEKIKKYHKKAEQENADLVVFSELSITGYSPEDLLFKDSFLEEVGQKLDEIADSTKKSSTAILMGTPFVMEERGKDGVSQGTKLYNSAILVKGGFIEEVFHKSLLPNQGVFDEKRYFESSRTLGGQFKIKDVIFHTIICEDLWSDKNIFLLREQKDFFDGIISINASPFTEQKHSIRFKKASKMAKLLEKPLLYVNQVGGQDSLVFDGNSFTLDKEGSYTNRLNEFEEDFKIIEFAKDKDNNLKRIGASSIREDSGRLESIYDAMMLGLKDYLGKSGFTKAIIGLSGGVDSALTAAVTVDVLGSKNVTLVALPSRYTSEESMNDARECAENLGVKIKEVSIEPAFNAILESLSGEFSGTKVDVTEENIQARLRGNILMAMSNKFGSILITTGNKSEMAVGYATLYGDMCGGFSVLKDVYKTDVFKISEWRNNNIPKNSQLQKLNVIPKNIISKPPTAELRADQKDSDSLPEYEELDAILKLIIEGGKSIDEVVKQGFKKDIVEKIARLFYNSEYKRRQAPIGVKTTSMSFDKDRRYPIVNKYKK